MNPQEILELDEREREKESLTFETWFAKESTRVQVAAAETVDTTDHTVYVSRYDVTCIFSTLETSNTEIYGRTLTNT